MRRCSLALVFLGACAAQQHEATTPKIYGTVAAICTARREEIVRNASTPPSPPETAAWETARNLCADILAAIEAESANE